jgi:hypothetical protein
MTKLCFPQKVLDQHAAVLGKTGAGKSSAVRHVVEHLLDHKKRVCIIDPKGDWWGLKAAADGKGAGYPVITFGDFKGDYDADVPINKESGKHIAELVTSGNRPAIIGFRGWFTADMLHFWIDFAKTLFHLNEGELFLIIDETQNFAPKGSTRTIEGQGGLALHWTNRLLAEGRGLGINIWVCSQRPQKVHNDTLDGCETLVAMRVVHPAARGAIKDWIEGAEDKEKGKQVLDSIGGMKRGEAVIWSPEIEFGPERVAFPMFRTFDSFAPPQLQKKVSQRSWADIDLEQVKEKLASVIEEHKANDPRELRVQLARSKADLTALQSRLELLQAAAPKTETKIETETVYALKDSQITRLEKWIARAEKMTERFKSLKTLVAEGDGMLAFLSDAVERLRAPVTAATAPSTKSLPTPPIRTQAEVKAKPSTPAPGPLAATGGDGDCALGKKVERALLTAIAQHPKGLTKQQVLIYADYRRSGDTDQAFRKFVKCGYASESGDFYVITAAGVDVLGPVAPLPTGAALRSQMLADSRLKKVERELIRVIFDVYPATISKDAALERANYRRSGDTDQAFRKFVTAGWTAPAGDGFRAVDELFES